MHIDQLKNSIILVTESNTAIYIPSPSYSLGLYSHNGPEMSLKKWFMKSLYGDPKCVKMLFENTTLTSEWWDYILEHKNQFLSKLFIKQNTHLLKKTYNLVSYQSNFENLDLSNNCDVINFFVQYDLCNQVLAAGKYLPNNFDSDNLKLLNTKQILDIMHNHLIILDEKLDLSTLQNQPQQDTLNHICTHVTLEFWKWQGWI